MENLRGFNLRVYGILWHENRILMLQEDIQGASFMKFPGGGVELGEGLIDCLQREFMEELNLSVQICRHFYTQKNFIASKFRPHLQLQTIYYEVTTKNLNSLQSQEKCIEKLIWLMPKEALHQNMNLLPIDTLVLHKLVNESK